MGFRGSVPVEVCGPHRSTQIGSRGRVLVEVCGPSPSPDEVQRQSPGGGLWATQKSPDGVQRQSPGVPRWGPEAESRRRFVGRTEVPRWGPEAESRWRFVGHGSPQMGSRGRFPVEVCGPRPPEADDNFSIQCINTAYTETLDNIYIIKSTLQHFQGASALSLLAHACECP